MPYSPRQEERVLVEGCLRGEQQAQKRLFEKYYGKMLGVCQRYTKDRDEAKDILQEGFVKVFQKLGQFAFNSPLDGWVRRIMVNTAIDHYRKAAAEPHTQEIDNAHEIADDHTVLSDMNHAELLECLHDLPAGYRMVFNMYVVEGFSHKEIAEALNVTEGTSKSQLAKARMYLQRVVTRKYSQHNG